MHDHSCCVALFAASIVALSAIVAYFNAKLSLARKNTQNEE